MSKRPSTECLFYHLERTTLEHVLPGLLEKSLERGWRAVVQASSQERVEALNAHLWTYRDESFLPHGLVNEGHAESQPIILTTENDNPNEAAIRFLVDGADVADPEELQAYERAVYIFDGADEDAITKARAQWKNVKNSGLDVTYWQQNEKGRWEKKA